jgi:hypothetical protein
MAVKRVATVVAVRCRVLIGPVTVIVIVIVIVIVVPRLGWAPSPRPSSRGAERRTLPRPQPVVAAQFMH